ncbi:MAG TPA: MFS transporter [Gammaproteobacteria bacterium]
MSSATPSAEMPPDQTRRLTPVERWLSLCASVRAGEGASVLLFFAYAFLLLVCYYVLKTIREPLLLTDGSAELKSYAYAAIAAVLLVLVPLYGVLFRRTGRRQLVRAVTVVFIGCLLLFYAAGRAGLDIGFVYYVWVGVFGVMMLTQFWAHAAHSYRVESGIRLFPVIMAGAAVGGLAGPLVAGALHEALGVSNLLLVAAALLAATLPLVEWTWRRVPAESRNDEALAPSAPASSAGGFSLVLRDRYLLLLAVLALLLNCVGTTGEYILTELVTKDAERRVALDPNLAKDALITEFFSDYYFTTNALGLVLQLLVVARLFRSIGMQAALLVLPVLALIGYGLILVTPILGIIRAVKVLENSTNYTLMNTARHMLYLPLPAVHQYEGKTVVDAFFWRCGDLLQAALIFVGLNVFGFGFEEFALVNILLAAAWLLVVVRIGARYPREHAVGRPAFGWRGAAVGACSAAFAVAALAAKPAAAQEPALFADDEPLVIELALDFEALCQGSGRRRECGRKPAELEVLSSDGGKRTLAVSVQARGRWRNESAHCNVPPLFVFFEDETAGTPFAGQTMLPVTTHCRERSAAHEQYVLEEYLAYRIYNAVTDKSLRVRLARVTYKDLGRRGRSTERFAFFTEHFESFAARHGATLEEAARFEPTEARPHDLALLEIFQYLIGNTDWSFVAGHNITHVRDDAGTLHAVPYDFDFSGLVNADYAMPPPQLGIRRVTQRLFRGFCHPGLDWDEPFAEFRAKRDAIGALGEHVPGLAPAERARVQAFVAEFFATLDSPDERKRRIVEACRPAQ